MSNIKLVSEYDYMHGFPTLARQASIYFSCDVWLQCFVAKEKPLLASKFDLRTPSFSLALRSPYTCSLNANLDPFILQHPILTDQWKATSLVLADESSSKPDGPVWRASLFV